MPIRLQAATAGAAKAAMPFTKTVMLGVVAGAYVGLCAALLMTGEGWRGSLGWFGLVGWDWVGWGGERCGGMRLGEWNGKQGALESGRVRWPSGWVGEDGGGGRSPPPSSSFTPLLAQPLFSSCYVQDSQWRRMFTTAPGCVGGVGGVWLGGVRWGRSCHNVAVLPCPTLSHKHSFVES